MSILARLSRWKNSKSGYFGRKLMKRQRLRFSKLPFLPKIYTESKRGIIDQDNGVKSGYFQACGLLRKWLFLKLGVINPRALK